MSKLSVYGGTGFVGGNFSRMYPDDTIVIPRDQREPESDEILYLISTVDNYNVHTNITLDVETNLKVLCETLDKCRDLDVTFNFIISRDNFYSNYIIDFLAFKPVKWIWLSLF